LSEADKNNPWESSTNKNNESAFTAIKDDGSVPFDLDQALKFTYAFRDSSVELSTDPTTLASISVSEIGSSNSLNNVDTEEVNIYRPSESVLESIAIIGPGSNEDKKFILDISAENLAEHDEYKMEAAQFTIGYDAAFFKDIAVDDIWISSPSVANSVKIDNSKGEITIASATLSDLIHGSETTNDILASIQFNFNETAFRNYQDINNEDINGEYARLSFEINVNEYETVLSKGIVDGSGFDNREIKTLSELELGATFTGQETTLFKALVNLEEQGDGLTLGTERIIGSTESVFTNLIRSGDTVTGKSLWKNKGNIKGENIKVVSHGNENGLVVD